MHCGGPVFDFYLRAAVHVVAVSGALYFFVEWIRPPFETTPLKSPSFWVIGAVFSYHMLRLAAVVIPLIGAEHAEGFPGFDGYIADLTASLVYALFLLMGGAVSARRDFGKKS